MYRHYNYNDYTNSFAIYHSWLQDFELHRYNSYRREEEKIRYCIRHGVLREELSLLCGIEAFEVKFNTNKSGRLFLSNQTDDTTKLYFSLATSHDQFALLITPEIHSGIDIEKINYLSYREVNSIAAFFNPKEQAYFQSIGESSYLNAFYKIWTGKECLIKSGIPDVWKSTIIPVDDTIVNTTNFSFHWQIAETEYMMCVATKHI